MRGIAIGVAGGLLCTMLTACAPPEVPCGGSGCEGTRGKADTDKYDGENAPGQLFGRKVEVEPALAREDESLQVVNPLRRDLWADPQKVDPETHANGDILLFRESPLYRPLKKWIGCRMHAPVDEPTVARAKERHRFGKEAFEQHYFHVEYYGEAQDPQEARGFRFTPFFKAEDQKDDEEDTYYGISPILRLVRQGDYQPDKAQNLFASRGAIIYLAGIRNKALGKEPDDKDALIDSQMAGADWQHMPHTLLCRIMQWNAMQAHPTGYNTKTEKLEDVGHLKLKDPPAYVQIVPNANGLLAGAKGKPDLRAANTFKANLWMAFQVGVEHLEVLTHSNGAVTAHVGYMRFIDQFRDYGDTQATAMIMRRKEITDRPMHISFFHFQAAQTYREDPKPKDVSHIDVKEEKYFDNSDVIVSFRYYYSGNDKLTFYIRDSGDGTNLGRHSTAKWLWRVNKRYPEIDAAQYFIAHSKAFTREPLEFPGQYYTRAPGDHEQRGVLEWFSDPRLQWLHELVNDKDGLKKVLVRDPIKPCGGSQRPPGCYPNID